jgi:hypothetical protein
MPRSATGPAAAASCGRPSVLGLSVSPARVAELVYAMDSKSIVRKDLWVRVPPRVLQLIARLDAEGGPNLRAQTAFSERNG